MDWFKRNRDIIVAVAVTGTFTVGPTVVGAVWAWRTALPAPLVAFIILGTLAFTVTLGAELPQLWRSLKRPRSAARWEATIWDWLKSEPLSLLNRPADDSLFQLEVSFNSSRVLIGMLRRYSTELAFKSAVAIGPELRAQYDRLGPEAQKRVMDQMQLELTRFGVTLLGNPSPDRTEFSSTLPCEGLTKLRLLDQYSLMQRAQNLAIFSWSLAISQVSQPNPGTAAP